MLELQALFLRAWVPDPTASHGARVTAWARAILGPAAAPVGCARSELARGPFWLAWLRPPSVRVCEADDEPLVFTVRRGWLLPHWDVRDADDYPVGWVRGRVLRDRWERTLAMRQDLPNQAGASFRGPRGEELARLESSRGESRLTFGAAVAGDPFARMLLLAAALVRA